MIIKMKNKKELIKEIKQLQNNILILSKALNYEKEEKDFFKLFSNFLRSNLREVWESSEDRTTKSFVKSDQKFHTLLIGISGNKLLLETWTQLYTRSSVQTIVSEHQDDLLSIAKIHLPIIEAIKQNNAQAYSAAIVTHYENIITNI